MEYIFQTSIKVLIVAAHSLQRDNMACLSLCIFFILFEWKLICVSSCLHLFFCFLVLYFYKRPFSNGLFLWGVLTDRIVISLGLSAGSLGVAHLVVAVTLLLW